MFQLIEFLLFQLDHMVALCKDFCDAFLFFQRWKDKHRMKKILCRYIQQAVISGTFLSNFINFPIKTARFKVLKIEIGIYPLPGRKTKI